MLKIKSKTIAGRKISFPD